MGPLLAAHRYDRLTAVVVLPTPPLMLVTAIIFIASACLPLAPKFSAAAMAAAGSDIKLSGNSTKFCSSVRRSGVAIKCSVFVSDFEGRAACAVLQAT